MGRGAGTGRLILIVLGLATANTLYAFMSSSYGWSGQAWALAPHGVFLFGILAVFPPLLRASRSVFRRDSPEPSVESPRHLKTH